MRDVSVLLHNIRSLHNVGAIFRTADGAGVKKIYLTGYTGIPPRKEIHKVALGAEEVIPWEQSKDPVPVIKKLKKDGVKIVALELTDNSINIKDYKGEKPICLILGHEVDGVDSELLGLADEYVQIPMRGIKESLNVSVAFGIAAYELVG